MECEGLRCYLQNEILGRRLTYLSGERHLLGKLSMKTKTTDPDPMPGTFSVEGVIWKYAGPAGWYFVNLGQEDSALIKWVEGKKKVGWGYVCVKARIGGTQWETTLFPTKAGHYMIAIKAVVRKKEGLKEGDTVRIDFELA